ncbi:hypothetical protein JCM6882_009688 [Rhodosporidiobolus microsporus]
MDTVVLPAEPSDWTRLVDIETASFSPSTINRACFAAVTREASHAFSLKRFQHALRDPQRRIFKAVRGGEIVGWAMWEVPLEEGQNKFVSQKEDQPGFPEGTNVEEVRAFFPKLELGIEEPHFHLSILVVDPTKYRTGAARALIQWGVDQADAQGKEIYLESSPEARAVYPKFGFSAIRSPIVGGTQNQLVVYPMRRVARRPRTSASLLPPPIPSTNGSFSTSPASTPSSQSLVDALPATASDLDHLARLQGLAFEPSVISRLIFTDVPPEVHIAHSAQRLQKALDDPFKAVCKAVLRETGQIVGLALWELPKPRDAPGAGEKKKREWPEGTNVQVAEDFFGQEQHDPVDPNYHLSILAVDPSKQRTGAGGALVKWGCKKADEEGMPMDLKATDVGVPLYARCGFKMDRPAITGGVNDEIILYPMSRAALTVSPLTRSEIPSIPRIYYLSFRPSQVMNYSFPNVSAETLDPWVTARMEGTLAARETGDKGDTLVAKRGEEVVGYAWFSYYPRVEEREMATGEKKARLLPEGANVERANRFLDALEAHKAKIPEAHYSLDNLCVLPEAQRSGVGKALTVALLEKARFDGVSVTLESMEGGLPLYTHLGFKPFAQPLRMPDCPEVDLVVPMRWTPEEQ